MNSSLLFITAIKNNSTSINQQSVRWRRPTKPFWLGLAKTKMFVLPKVTEVPEVEKKEIRRIVFSYHTEHKSIMNFICNSNPKLLEINARENMIANREASSELKEKILESLEKNEKWNAASAKMREDWKAKVKQNKTQYAEKIVAKQKKKLETLQDKIEEVVKKEKHLSESFITLNTLDKAIEYSVNNPVVYDFAIDLEGNKYFGRESLKLNVENTDTSVVLEEEIKENI